MKKEDIRSLIQNMLEKSPEVLDEILAARKEEFTKLAKPQTIRITERQKDRIENLCSGKGSQAEVIRKALDIGLTQLEKQQ